MKEMFPLENQVANFLQNWLGVSYLFDKSGVLPESFDQSHSTLSSIWTDIWGLPLINRLTHRVGRCATTICDAQARRRWSRSVRSSRTVSTIFLSVIIWTFSLTSNCTTFPARSVSNGSKGFRFHPPRIYSLRSSFSTQVPADVRIDWSRSFGWS